MRWADDMRWFVVVADLEHVTEAASTLGMSQSALSRKLARLESDLGLPLFVRHGRRLTLAPAGQVLREHCVRAIAELDGAQRRISELADGESNTVRLDFLHSFGTWLVPSLLRGLHQYDPTVRVELYQDAADVLVDRVATGVSDVALVSPRPNRTDVVFTLVARQPLAIAVADSHELATAISLTLEDVKNEAFVTMHREFGMRRIFDELCAAESISPAIVFEASELTTVLGLVSAGLGVALVPVDDAEPPPGVVLARLDNARTTREIGLVTPTGRILSAATKKMTAFAEMSQKMAEDPQSHL